MSTKYVKVQIKRGFKMEDFILGLLMPNKFTAYELHQLIKNNYQSICSHSVGNVQRALKKLHEKNFVKLNEVMDGKVTKKIYEITPAGRAQMLKWLNTPPEVTKAKNMEIGKLLLLGFLPQDKRIMIVEGQIDALKAELEYLQTIVSSQEAQLEEYGQSVTNLVDAHIQNNKEYMDELVHDVNATDAKTLLADVAKYGNLTLKLGIAEIKFFINWFEGLRSDMLAEK